MPFDARGKPAVRKARPRVNGTGGMFFEAQVKPAVWEARSSGGDDGHQDDLALRLKRIFR